MATEEQVRLVLSSLAEVQSCPRDGTRFRFGDVECPHCGADLEDTLRRWAERLVDALVLGRVS